jgi:hypothetical protein
MAWTAPDCGGPFALQAIWFPIAIGPHSVELNLLGLLMFPSAVLLLGAPAGTMRHKDHAQWIAMAIGAAVAAVAIVLTVIAAMGIIALIVAS